MGKQWGRRQRTEPGGADPTVTSSAPEVQMASVALEEPRSPLLEAENFTNFTSPEAHQAHRQARHAAPSEPSEPQRVEIPSYLRPTAASVNRCTLPRHSACRSLRCHHNAPLPPRRYTATPPSLQAATSRRLPLKPPPRHAPSVYRLLPTYLPQGEGQTRGAPSEDEGHAGTCQVAATAQERSRSGVRAAEHAVAAARGRRQESPNGYQDRAPLGGRTACRPLARRAC